jgi:hypothetical protein
MNKLGASLIGSLLFAGALALISCNGDTGTAGSGAVLGNSAPGPGTGPVPVAGPTGTRVQLLASSPQMPSSGTTSVDLTALVVDANGQAVSGATVVFSTGTDPSALIDTINPAGGVSDTNGSVTAKLKLGSNKSNRFISVTASTQGATATTGVDVTGTAITVSGNSSLALGASTALTFSLKDSAGVALPGFTMTLTSAAGNSISPATGTTNSAGQLVTTVTGNVGGNDTITATAGGTSKTQALTVSGAGFTFTAPPPSVDIPLSTPTTVSVHWTTTGGAAVVGQPVTFASSRGTMTGSPSTTNGAGDTPGVSISSTSAGTATISASGPGGTPAATLNVTFVATTASSVAAQAVPGTIQFTTGAGSQTSNKSTISVVVRDAANNLVKNAGVNFTVTADPTAGSLSSARAITDVNGGASVTYTAGTVSSPQNGVAVKATVTDISGVPIGGPAITNTATLTVSGQSLLVRLGTDNLVVSQPPLNKKTWVAVVTDAGGNAVPNQTVTFALRPGRYKKGQYDVFDTTANVWTRGTVPANPVTLCQNEDKNFNSIVDPGEDNDPVNGNNNGRLEPGGVATVNTSAVTDASGIATAVITYPKDHATWAEYQLEGRTGVTSNDPPTVATFFLVGLASDYTDKNVPPPGALSPYGIAGVCTNPN